MVTEFLGVALCVELICSGSHQSGFVDIHPPGRASFPQVDIGPEGMSQADTEPMGEIPVKRLSLHTSHTHSLPGRGPCVFLILAATGEAKGHAK